MSPIVIPIALLLAAAVAIFLACEFFVNGVEWLGRRLSVGQKATGTLLAAFGTALPESLVTLVAVAFGTHAGDKHIGIGAAMGGPLALGGIAYAVVGVSLLACRRRLPRAPEAAELYSGLSRDQGWFVVVSLAKLLAGLFAFAFKPWLGLVFLAAYAAYAWKEITAPASEDEGEIEPLKLAPRTGTPGLAPICLQTGGALVVIFVASRLFVGQLDALGPWLGLKPQLLSLLVSPIATELPETLNAIIWVRQGKVKLALANISGAMMIQATIPTAFGLFFTPWRLDPPLVLAGSATLMAVAVLFAAFRWGWVSRRWLTGMAVIYAGFVGAVLGFGG